ncbi:DNA primase [Patescibacteria group bacterium]|nr:MAG: DNA primase [Patescibacteria group bacterium]
MNTAVEDVKSRINIVDLVGEYVKLQKAGSNWKAPCPFHREKSPSFMVSEEKQIWHCFGCGKGGDAFGFVMEAESLDFKEALRLLADKAGVDLQQYQTTRGFATETPKGRTPEILELATKFFEKQLWDGVGKTKILEYLRQRGLKDETIREFRLGYAPAGWRNLLDFLTGRGYSAEEVNATGLLVQKTEETQADNNAVSSTLRAARYYDRFRDRIMFPIQDSLGRVVGFTGRVAPGGDESQAKYVNTPETALYHKSKILYGLDKAKRAIKDKGGVLIVEGNMDVIAAHQAGIKNAVAVSGTALTAEQIDMLKRYSDNMQLMFDMDSAGEEAIRRSAALCFQKDMNVSIVRLPEGKDAAEVVQKNPELLQQALKGSTHAMDYLLQGLLQVHDRRTPAGKKSIVNGALEYLAEFKSDIERQHWIKTLAEIVGVEEKIVSGVLDSVARRKAQPDRNSARVVARPEVSQKERTDILAERMSGLMLAFPAIWNKVADNNDGILDRVAQSFFREIVEQGRETNFVFETVLSQTVDEKLKQLLQSLFFGAKFQLVTSGDPVEVELGEAEKQFAAYVESYVQEQNRKRLQALARDMRKAEADGDETGLKLLVDEFNNLSKSVR